MIVSKWTAAHIKALRDDALRLSQPAFAERLGYQTVTICKWEQKATAERPVRGDSAAALDTELARLTDGELCRMRRALGIEEDEEVNRRQFGAVGAAGAVALVGSTLLPDSTPMPALGGRMGLDDVRGWVDLAEDLERRDQYEGGARLVDEAVTKLRNARSTLDSAACDPATATAAASAVGNLAAIVGWLAYDADRNDQARGIYSEALELAMRSGDDELAVHALLKSATQEISLSRLGLGNPHLALQHAARARHLAEGWRPGRVHALISVRQAQAYARIGDYDRFRTSMDDAHSSMDTALERELLTHAPRWLRFVDPAELASHEARAYSDLGDTRAALTLYEQALQDQHARNGANTRAWYARARASIGDLRGAIVEAEPVLTALETSVGSTRTLRAMAPIRHLAGADDGFSGRYDQLNLKALPA